MTRPAARPKIPDRLMGLPLVWGPWHYGLARAARRACATHRQRVVLAVLLEHWIAAQGSPGRTPSPRFRVSMRQVAAEIDAKPGTRRHVPDVIEQLVARRIVAWVSRPRSSAPGRRGTAGVLTIAPLLERAKGMAPERCQPVVEPGTASVSGMAPPRCQNRAPTGTAPGPHLDTASAKQKRSRSDRSASAAAEPAAPRSAQTVSPPRQRPGPMPPLNLAALARSCRAAEKPAAVLARESVVVSRTASLAALAPNAESVGPPPCDLDAETWLRLHELSGEAARDRIAHAERAAELLALARDVAAREPDSWRSAVEALVSVADARPEGVAR